MSKRPGESNTPATGKSQAQDVRDEQLERRRRDLESSLASRRQERQTEEETRRTGGLTGFGSALRLSSEFIAAVIVGGGLGWVIDHWAGTTPWGLIIFLLLGFAAGVLNVMRSTGQVAEAGIRKSDAGSPDKN